MAGSSMTFSYDDGQDRKGQPCRIRRITCDWVSDDSAGTASGTTEKIVGELIKITTDPGSAAPSANWDVVLTDDEGVSITGACLNTAALIARHTTTSEETYLNLSDLGASAVGIAAFPVVCGAITVAVANAGNSKTGQIIIYYRV